MFADWAMRYLEVGISSFPVEIVRGPDGKAQKKPAITKYLNATTATTKALIEGERFQNADAIGIPLRKNKITLVDIDCDDPAAVEAAVKQFGESPFVVHTPSGGKHIYFRNSGETRNIRYVDDPSIDLLGDGFAVAAPSMGLGARYEIIKGDIADLQKLPPIREVVSREARSIPKGVRNVSLWRHLMSQARHCDDLETLEDVGFAFNLACQPPMLETEVKRTAASAWKYETEGNNWFGTKGMIAIPRELLLSGLTPDELYLYARLREAHAGLREEFAIANDAAPAALGMPRRRLLTARKGLLDRRVLVQTHSWSGRKGDPHRYKFGR